MINSVSRNHIRPKVSASRHWALFRASDSAQAPASGRNGVEMELVGSRIFLFIDGPQRLVNIINLSLFTLRQNVNRRFEI